MAMNLTIVLSDSEDVMVTKLAKRELPGATNAQVKDWAERYCKQGLRAAVQTLWKEIGTIEARADSAARDVQAAADFPEVP